MEDMGNYGYTLFRTIPFAWLSGACVITTFSGRLPCMFLSVPDYVVQDG